MRYLQIILLLAPLLYPGCSEQPEGTTAENTTGQLENGSFFAELNGFRIHYEIHGQGPVLMTVPNSWGITIDPLRTFYRPLEDQLTLVYFDPRGMGDSAPVREDSDMGLAAVRSDFDALRRHLNLEEVHVIGWSNGAVNLLFLALEKPEILASAIILHGAASFTAEDAQAFAAKHPELMQSFLAYQEESRDPSITDTEKSLRLRTLWLEEFLPTSCADPVEGKKMLARVFANCPFSWKHAAYSNQEAPTFDARDRLGGIAVRTLIIAGTHDMTPLAQAETLDQGIPDSSLTVFEKSGHFAPMEEPEKFRETVLRFLTATGTDR